MGDFSNLQIRVMQLKDIDDIVAIEQVSQINPWSKQQIQDCLQAGYSNYVLMLNDKVIGYAFMAVANDQADLLTIAIEPVYQRQGHGRRLLQHLIQVMQEKNINKLYLEVRVSNIAAIELYQQLGFKEIGTRKQYYKTPTGREDAKVMSFNLQ